MASTGNWSVVGKGKKAKGPSQPLTKTQKKQFMDNMPRIEALDPVKEDSTIYDAFVQQEQNRMERKQMERFADKIESGKEPNGKGISDGGAKKKGSAQKNKKAEQSPRKKPFDDGIKEVTEADLKSVLLQSKGHFPDKPELWLKDLVTYLNMKLEHCPDTDKYLKKELTDYPASCLKKGCTKVITSVLSDCSPTTLNHVLYFCIMTMLEENQNGNSTYGYKIFLQLLIRGSPDIVMSKLAQYRDVVKSVQNRPDRCILVMWALGQVGYPNLRCGLRVWLDIMFPLLGFKALGSYCVQYLESILCLHSKSLNGASGEFKVGEFFQLTDLLYGSTLPGDIRKRLMILYPQIKKIAFGTNQFRHFFTAYLKRAMPDSAKDIRKEVLTSLLECLNKDPHTYAQWCQEYTHYLKQSRVLLEHITDKWDSLHGTMNKELLKQTLMTFQRTNEENSRGKNAADWLEMTVVCEDLLKKMSKPRFPWRLLMFFLVSTVIAIVTYDVYTSKTLKSSRTVRFLEAYGVLGILQTIWTNLTHYFNIASQWLQVNIPIYYKIVKDAVAPIIQKVSEIVVQVWENTREHRVFIYNKVYALAPEVWNEIGRYLALCWDFILEYTYWIQGHIAVMYNSIYHWVDVNILKGNLSIDDIRQTVSWSANKLHVSFNMLIDWCRQFWS
ncbi:hypothetical protein ACF0H5_004019 [Mactra antiquata]